MDKEHTCPFCGAETVFDEVDVGVGTITGPDSCVVCCAYQTAERVWQPPDPEYTTVEDFNRLMTELLALRRVEHRARQLLESPTDAKRLELLRWAIKNDDLKS